MTRTEGREDAERAGALTGKAQLRRRLRAERRTRSDQVGADLARELGMVVLEIPEVSTAGTVAVYSSMGTEPGTGPLREALREAGVRVLLPVLLEDDDLDWVVDDGGPVPTGARLVPDPEGPRLGRAALAEADVVVVPALAVDTLGHRLGQGGGSYDRALARKAPVAVVVAAVHDDEVLDAAVECLPSEPHDLGVDVVATPSRWLRLRS